MQDDGVGVILLESEALYFSQDPDLSIGEGARLVQEVLGGDKDSGSGAGTSARSQEPLGNTRLDGGYGNADLEDEFGIYRGLPND